MEGRAEGLNLLHERVSQLLASAHRNCRNIVDRLVGVQFNWLTTGVGQAVNHVRLDLQQAQLKHLKQAHRARANDDRIRLNGLMCVGGVDDLLIQLRFHTYYSMQT